jgi:hypothetical protein
MGQKKSDLLLQGPIFFMPCRDGCPSRLIGADSPLPEQIARQAGDLQKYNKSDDLSLCLAAMSLDFFYGK